MFDKSALFATHGGYARRGRGGHFFSQNSSTQSNAYLDENLFVGYNLKDGGNSIRDLTSSLQPSDNSPMELLRFLQPLVNTITATCKHQCGSFRNYDVESLLFPTLFGVIIFLIWVSLAQTLCGAMGKVV